MNQFLMLLLIRGWSVALGSVEASSDRDAGEEDTRHQQVWALFAVRDEHHLFARAWSHDEVLRAAASMALRLDEDLESESSLYGETTEQAEEGF